MDTECPPAGFESHWDAPWFKAKADECRHLASFFVEQHHRNALLAMAEDFTNQSNHAALLAGVALSKLVKR